MPIEDPQPWRGWRYLDEARGVETFQLLKAAVTDALALPASGRAIDVGCGTGDDVASSVGSADGAFAVGIDNDRSVLVEANRRWTDTRTAFAVADAHHLPIVSGCMHGCRSERTLQHVGDPAAVVAELARVLRPGGRLALTEPDWETCVVGGATPGLSRTVIENWLGRNLHPTVGRQLTGLVVRQGLTVAHLDGRAVCYRELDEADRVFPLRRAGGQAAAEGLIGAADFARWTSELTDASTKGEFLRHTVHRGGDETEVVTDAPLRRRGPQPERLPACQPVRRVSASPPTCVDDGAPKGLIERNLREGLHGPAEDETEISLSWSPAGQNSIARSGMTRTRRFRATRIRQAGCP